MQELFHLVAYASRFLHSQTGAAAQVQTYQASINRGEKVLSQKEHPPEREQAERKKATGEQLAVLNYVVSRSW